MVLSQLKTTFPERVMVILRLFCMCIGAFAFHTAFASDSDLSSPDIIEFLRRQLAAQKEQIDMLKSAIASQQQLLDHLTKVESKPPASERMVTTSEPSKVLVTETSTSVKNFHGFEFSGDFRWRFDLALRSGNTFANPLQNARERYRVRFNIDKEFDSKFKFHFQLSTGAYSNGLTNDQDFGGIAKNPFAISEAYVDYHPNSRVSMRVGRMSEVFTDDDMRFLSDDNVRFTGTEQRLRIPLSRSFFGFNTLEFRSGEYILSNPAVTRVQPNSPYLTAGYTLGERVRDASLIHPGFILFGKVGLRWKTRFMGAIETYQNPNQIQLASTVAGQALAGNPLGLTFSDPLNGSGNAVSAPGSALLAAKHYQIVHIGYNLEARLGVREVPFFIDLQASRNIGTGKYRDGLMASISLGGVKKFGDIRTMYQFGIKDANSMISQFTDDDFGTATGVNLAVHSFRFYLGLTKFLQFQNLFFIQNELRGNNPAEHFFVPLQRGAHTTYRYLGQFAFTF
jgi:hypothetical protein